MIRRKRGGPRGSLRSRWSNTTAATGWGESTFAEQAWGQSRSAATRWAVAGVLAGAAFGVVAFAPAAWLAERVASATDQRLLLADARGTVWAGSAVAVLTGGAGSRDASALPGRVDWSVGPTWLGFSHGGVGFELLARQACCLNGTVVVIVKPGFGRVSATLVPPSGWVGQWPAAWLVGLGTPWNTLQLGGVLRLASPGLTVETAQGRWRVDGQAELALMGASSRLATVSPLGSYRLTLTGDAANAGVSQLGLGTQDGALQLSGNGSWAANGVRFRGEARAAPGAEAALSNLLNIIGRRDGARSVISIG